MKGIHTPITDDDKHGPSGTQLESADEIRQALLNAGNSTTSGGALPAQGSPPIELASAAEVFRPHHRPRMAVLRVHFDGEDSGQEFAIYASPFIIGRVEGDLVIKHDNEISGRHAELVQVIANGRYYWQLHDLGSTNGTFVRARLALLNHMQELLIGGRRYRFEVADGKLVAADVGKESVPATRKAGKLIALAGKTGLASLVEVNDNGLDKRFPLTKTEHWIGRDPRLCSIVFDDVMVSLRHAKIYRDERNRWVIANANSLNGVWLKICRIDLGTNSQFQLGEQRFSFRMP